MIRKKSYTVRCLTVIALAMAFVVGSGGWVGADEAPVAATAESVVLVATIDGPIGPATADYLASVLTEAAERRASAVVLRLNTPGGLVSSTRTIVSAILASTVPVITYVAPPGGGAASAGTYIAYASHVAAMAPATNIGAATPIPMGGSAPLPGGGPDDDADAESEDGPDIDRESGDSVTEDRPPRDAAEAKMINDAVAYIRSLAELRGRNADWAERSVTEAASLTATEAERQRVVDLMAGSVADLLSAVDGRRVIVAGDREIELSTDAARLEEVEPGLLLEILAVITNPNITLILLVLGVYGLIFEFLAPGSFVPGTIGILSLILGMYALNVLPFSYAGAALLIVGLALMAGEAVVPSFGALGIGGALAFAVGAGMLIDTSAPGFGISWIVIGVATALTLSLALFVLSAAIRSGRRPERLEPAMPERQLAKVVSWKVDAGTVTVDGKTWTATGNGPFEPGETVNVIDSNGRTLIVGREGG
ncbi:nodulation protein NfeD [Fodinicurvata sp. EGI_FJ10296]|uniref:NfeD family protein n=1 Tax=Fodinicurvata sp. EGI_FJ10296 TaxID=3231908 RepID=UPI0034565DF6